jgi:hypothetical protein
MIEFLTVQAPYVVLWVTLTVWAGIAVFLLWLEHRLRRLEAVLEQARRTESDAASSIASE